MQAAEPCPGTRAAAWVRWATLLAMTALAGCASAPQAEQEAMPLAGYDAPAAPTDWRVRARTAIGDGDESATASLWWQQSDAHYRVDLRGPMGSGAVRVTGDAGGARLRTAAGERYSAASPRALVRRATGYDFPVEYLAWWLRGRPVPGVAGRVALDAFGLPQRIEQNGWRIRYDGFSEVSGYELPNGVEASRGDIRVRVARLRWQVDS